MNNLKSEQRGMSASNQGMDGGHGQNASKYWTGASQRQIWERQWPSKANRNLQQMDQPTTSSAAAIKREHDEEVEENSSIDGEEEEEALSDAEEDEGNGHDGDGQNTQGYGWELLSVDEIIQRRKVRKLKKKVHTRELLEEVLCPWEKILQIIKLCPDDYWKVLMAKGGANVGQCLVAFRVQGRDNNEMVYIDQINGIRQGSIGFKHYGVFEIDSIRPHYGPIGEEDFGKWLDKLISINEELPMTDEKIAAKKQLFNSLKDTISSSICGRIQQNFNLFFDGIYEPIDDKMFQQIGGMDISPIAVGLDFHLLLKLNQMDFIPLMTGLCVQVKISDVISHSMKFPPMMNLLNHMLIPISLVTFDAPKRYAVPKMGDKWFCNVLVHLVNGNGLVICSARLPQQMILPNEQLVKASLAVWRMNNLTLPTFEYVQQKGQQLQRALGHATTLKLPKSKGTLPFGPIRLNKNPAPRPENVERNKQRKLQKIARRERKRISKQAKGDRQRAQALELIRKNGPGPSTGIGSGGNGPKQEIGQQNVQPSNCKMPANFAQIVLKPAQFHSLRAKMTTQQFEQLVIGMFVHVKIPRNYKLHVPVIKALRGHFILPIAALSYNNKKGRNNVFVHFPNNIKLVCNKTGILLQKISAQQLQDSCADRFIEECAIILHTSKIAPPNDEFIAQKAAQLRLWR